MAGNEWSKNNFITTWHHLRPDRTRWRGRYRRALRPGLRPSSKLLFGDKSILQSQARGHLAHCNHTPLLVVFSQQIPANRCWTASDVLTCEHGWSNWTQIWSRRSFRRPFSRSVTDGQSVSTVESRGHDTEGLTHSCLVCSNSIKMWAFDTIISAIITIWESESELQIYFNS